MSYTTISTHTSSSKWTAWGTQVRGNQIDHQTRIDGLNKGSGYPAAVVSLDSANMCLGSFPCAATKFTTVDDPSNLLDDTINMTQARETGYNHVWYVSGIARVSNESGSTRQISFGSAGAIVDTHDGGNGGGGHYINTKFADSWDSGVTDGAGTMGYPIDFLVEVADTGRLWLANASTNSVGVGAVIDGGRIVFTYLGRYANS